jgi:hypothetical protein
VLIASDVGEGRSRGCGRSKAHECYVIPVSCWTRVEEKETVVSFGNAQKYLGRMVGDIIILLTQFRPCLASHLPFDSGGRTRRPETPPRAAPPLVCQEPNKPLTPARGEQVSRWREGVLGCSSTTLHRNSHRIAYPGRSSYLPYPYSQHCLSQQSDETPYSSTWRRDWSTPGVRPPRSVLQSTNSQRHRFGSSDSSPSHPHLSHLHITHPSHPHASMLRQHLASTFLASLALLCLLPSSSAQSTCNATSKCPSSAPCCSEYGYCGTGKYCLGGCEPICK